MFDANSELPQSQTPSRDQELYDKSEELRNYSKVLIKESQDLCNFCRKLRATNKRLVANNANPNAARNQLAVLKSAFEATSRTHVSFSIDVPLHRSRKNSKLKHFKVLEESKILE
ncbi:MAG TPA: hypothetical protein VFI24_21910 [Pyrinomonadaceae bacterium]|nr:hypothetical protein [Pyrinomonadaceae bacterium]